MVDVDYVTFPGLLRVDRPDGTFSVHNAAHGTSVDVEPESEALVEAVLEGFAEPCTLAAFQRAHDVPEQLVQFLVRASLVVEQRELPFLEQGFLRPTSTPLGRSISWSDVPELPGDGWVLLGVPVDTHALGGSGARHGPSEIRRMVSGPLLSGEGDVVDWELRRLYPALQLEVYDLGDVDPEGGRMDHVGSRLRKALRELLAIGARPLLLGGDHSITHYVLSELAEHVPRFGVIHFDAHADLLPSRGLSHASALRVAVEDARIDPLVQLGLRTVERVSPYARREACNKRTVLTARELSTPGIPAVLSALPRDRPYYLSFDIDCIDATAARETGTPAFGGLSVERASELVDYVARTFDLLGADFVEVAGSQGASHASASIAAGLLQRCLLGKSAFEPLTTDVYTF
ncbi:MAG TPA: arginase family protein [Polyangiales bacterium]